jgi:glutathione S-transferase
MPELLGLSYSPWSEKARWALEARGIDYAKRKYSPVVGELGLRRKLRKWSGVVSVPVFTLDDGTVLADSANIARWADHHGSGPTLFPPGHEHAIEDFIALSERGLSAGRTASLARLLTDDAAAMELVPRNLRRMPGARQLARVGIARTLRKYSTTKDAAAATAELTAVLDEIRAALAKAPATNGAKTLLGTFTFADIAVSQVLTYVEPPAFGLKLGDATRKRFADPELHARYGDLVAWRDALYETYRPR